MLVIIENETIAPDVMESKIQEWRYSRRTPERIAAYWAEQMISGNLRAGKNFPDLETMDRFHVKAVNTLLAAKHLLARSGWAARSNHHRRWVPVDHAFVVSAFDVSDIGGSAEFPDSLEGGK